MDNRLQLKLLGPIQITQNDALVIGFESQKALALLCYLAYLGEPVSRNKLSSHFWQNKPLSRGLGNLSRVLHNNKKLLPGYIQATGQTVQFVKTETCWIDTDIFQELGQEESIPSLKTAIELVRGDLMEGISLVDCPDFDNWLTNEQERWHQRIADVYYQLITLLTERGEYSEGINYTAQLLGFEPWREEAHRRMMLLLALSGQRLNAIQQYHVCQRILAEELGVEPSENTKILYEKILHHENILQIHIPISGQGISDVSHQRQLPVELPPLGDAAKEVDQILLRLQQPTCRLLTIIGENSNSLRDALAIHAAKNASAGFRDGMFYTPYLKNNDPAVILPPNEMEPGSPFEDGTAPSEAIFQYFRDKEILIALTNVSETKHVTELLEGILKRSPGVKIIITATQSIGSPYEWIYEVSATSAQDTSAADD